MLSSIPLWIDTDPSGLVWTGLDCDDDLAVLAALALQRRGRINLKGISVCGGNAPLSHTWPNIKSLLNHAGAENENVTPIKGYGWRSMQVAYKYLRYYNYLIPDSEDSDDASTALIDISTRQSSIASPINILTLGPVTNLARALATGKLDPTGVSHIYLMGGEMTGQPMDLNFRSDRAGVRTVFASNIPKTMITIQTCGQTAVTQTYLDLLDCPSMAACAIMPKMKQQIKMMPKYVNPYVKRRLLLHMPNQGGRWKASPNLDNGFVPWDVVALLAITHPEEFDDWEHHRVAIPPCPQGEPCDETMQILEDLGTTFDGKNWSGVVRVPHTVRNETQLLRLMFSLLNEIPATFPEASPPFYWGFYSALPGFIIVTILFLCCIFSRFKRKIKITGKEG